MGFLRRLLGGDREERSPHPDASLEPVDLAAEEQARDRELLRAEAGRLDDELLQRQLRYADRSWTPPPQGGARRAGDEDGAPEG